MKQAEKILRPNQGRATDVERAGISNLRRLTQRLRTLVALVMLVRRDKSAFPADAERAVAEEMHDTAAELASELARHHDEEDRRRPSRVPDIGALDQWWRELRAGVSDQDIQKPGTWKTDALWRAAGYEAAAREAQRQGLPETADLLRRRALSTVLDAAREQRRGANR
jgi:hypothetical protein